ncbi:PepSY domain-containing protein [Paenibacillus sp. N10]|uniref:PepSY domain-containing protein n=1 Tax=Paenibacillus lutrae TaxID=2078573 RepID=A0A7X3FEW3_9BACL|nr:PepSY domain-containing protein [Paenibacillus lutrae]
MILELKPSTGKENRLYRSIWRWHFYAGLIFAPLLILLAITGLIYLFKPQIEPILYKNLYVVQAGQQMPLPASNQIALVKERYPEADIVKFRPSDEPDRSSEVGIKLGEEALIVYVNPYTGAILGSQQESSQFMQIIKKLHGELLIGKIGDRIIELAACWAIILLVTGLYLWWPRDSKSIFGTFLPRFSNNKRIFWRDLHAVPAMWLSLGIVLLIMTGLPWSGVWGDNLSRIALSTQTGYPAQLWDNVPKSSLPAKAVADVPWAAGNMPVPQSGASHGTPTIPVEEVMRTVEGSSVHSGYTITMPQGDKGVYTVAVFPKFPKDQATLHIDRYSGEILADLRFANYGPLAQAIEIGIALHEGRYFGLPNQILGAIACMGLIGISLSGVIMWWKRKPAGRLGAPARPKERKFYKSIAIIVIGFGIFFPLVGVSLLAVLAIDWLVIRRVRKVKDDLSA